MNDPILGVCGSPVYASGLLQNRSALIVFKNLISKNLIKVFYLQALSQAFFRHFFVFYPSFSFEALGNDN